MNAVVWHTLDAISSRGASAGAAGSLGALAAHRRTTLSQFFTPAWVVCYAWGRIAHAFDLPGARYSLFDNSVGAGSMFRCADPVRFDLFGLDVDTPLLEQVVEALESGGYRTDLVAAPMESVRLGRYSAALINPPFSIPLSSPALVAFEGVTHYGRFGPDTHALSHEYALAQALAQCDVVAAVMPRSTRDALTAWPVANRRLRAVHPLPDTTFRGEGVDTVATDLLIFGPARTGLGHGAVEPINPASTPVPLAGLRARHRDELRSTAPSRLDMDLSTTAIRSAQTGDARVRLYLHGRQIRLHFHDALTEARVLNRLLRARLPHGADHRYAAGTRYEGQFQTSVDALLATGEPFAHLDRLVARIAEFGGVPIEAPDLRPRLRALCRRHAYMSVPYGHTVYRLDAPAIKAVARRMGLLNRTDRGAVVAMGESVVAQRTPAGFAVSTRRGTFDCTHDNFFALFQAEEAASAPGRWEQVHPPIRAAFPQQIDAIAKRASALGLDAWLSWAFQREDLAELAFRPYGGICGWQMALGKTRLALALAVLLPGASLIIVKSRLIEELALELEQLGVPANQVQVIDTVSRARSPRKINIISYERLGAPIDPRAPRVTLSRVLRGRVRNIFADEGGLLASESSRRTRATWQLGGRRHYLFDGTPCPNYPREMLPLACWAVGQSVAHQPYGMRDGLVHAGLVDSARGQPTGRQAFLDDYVCIEWATNEFLDTGRGARREVPRIRSSHLEHFRSWIAPIVKRRVQQEPDVTREVRFVVPVLNAPTMVPWARRHLQLYLKTVDEFAAWYREEQAARAQDGKQINLTLILARLEACFKAANQPSAVRGYANGFNSLTTKEVACAEAIERHVSAGRRPILFARSPDVLARIGAELERRGITYLLFTGRKTIKRRNAELNARIRNGSAQVMLASLGVTQDGLNLPELDTFMFYNRSWKSREEFQAIYRLIRAKQRRDVFGDFFCLSGSIDEYMGQVIDWKHLASEAGLDYGEQPETDFVHFDAFIERFLLASGQLREQLIDAA